MQQIKRASIPQVTQILLKRQGYKCPLCEQPLRSNSAKRPALDHCHETGAVRDVLCINCNGMEGKILSRVKRAKGKLHKKEFLENLLRYYERHSVNVHGLIHPTHKTAEDKRLATNAKARKRRAQLKAMQK